MRHHLDFALAAYLRDLDGIAQVAGPVIDFDFVVEEFLKGGDVEDFVRGGLGGVDYELWIWMLVGLVMELEDRGRG